MKGAVPSHWNVDDCRGFSQQELLLYRSNLLGSDLRITNYGGGNTSAKVLMKDPVSGEEELVLWVKGSGGDLGSMGLDGFATLYQKRLLSLEDIYRGREFEDEMVAYLPHCTFNLNPRAASIDTPLHCFVDKAHIDHLHPDALIALAAAKDGVRLTQQIFGGEIGWVPWQRPGFDLGLKIREQLQQKPDLKGVVMGGHGLMTWADDAKQCYEVSLGVINRAVEALGKSSGKQVFGGHKVETRSEADRQQLVAEMMPGLRARLCSGERKIGHYHDSLEVMEFVNSERAAELAELGTSCPDHFLRTKIWPLFYELGADLDQLLGDYAEKYAAYYERCKHADSPAMRDALPVVVLIPGVGMITFAKNKETARQSAEFYVNAINVMHGALSVSEYVGLPEQEAFNIEYWLLEEAKLKRQPPEKSLSRRVAWITGGAGGIGKATARRLLAERAVVLISDIDADALAQAHAELAAEYGADSVRSIVTDVTDEESVRRAGQHALLEFGGIDLAVCSAGLASASAFEDTSLETWQTNMDVLVTGYFLAAREAYRVMLKQGLGGSIVFISSKNALAASPQASAYCTAKAAELHLARCLALEGAEHQIRVNSINPDAVLQGSKIWQGEWRKERAAAYGLAEDDLDEHYRKRSLLKRSVRPEDIAEAVYFFCSERSSRSTGNLINVDAGVAAAFPR
jgi:rhamnulose-1-phosphate aldolase/alcohol dehydrogenase